MDNKKEQEREEVHKSLRKIANALRGNVDGWDFKSYVLGMMFYRFLSEKLTAYINKGEHEAGDDDFDYAALSDEEAGLEDAELRDLLDTEGFFIKPSELFVNVRKSAKDDENLNETIEKIFKHIEESAKGTKSEDDLHGLFDDFDVNSLKLGATVAKRNKKLVNLLDGIGEMQLGAIQDNTIDTCGDAYEYLMRKYASEAGKAGAEFYTPQEVSELLTRISIGEKKEVNKVYDPACGSANSAVRLTLAELETTSRYKKWVDVCKPMA